MATLDVKNIENLISETKRMAAVKSEVINAAAWTNSVAPWNGAVKIMAFEITKANFDEKFLEDLKNALLSFGSRLDEKVDANTEKLKAIETLIKN